MRAGASREEGRRKGWFLKRGGRVGSYLLVTEARQGCTESSIVVVVAAVVVVVEVVEVVVIVEVVLMYRWLQIKTNQTKWLQVNVTLMLSLKSKDL